MKRLLVHDIRHAVALVLRAVRGVAFFESLLELLLILQTLHVLHVLVPGVNSLLRLEFDRLALALVKLLVARVAVGLIVAVLVIFHLGDVVDERRGGAATAVKLLLLLGRARVVVLVVVLLRKMG